MKKYTLLFAIILLSILNCSRVNENLEPQIEQNSTNSLKYIAGYMFYDFNIAPYSNVSIDFINNNPVKRTFPAFAPNVIGGTYAINEGKYEELSYNGKIITVLQKYTDTNLIVDNGKRMITISNSNIIKKEDFDINNDKIFEIQYQYAGNKLISYTKYKPLFSTGGMYLYSKSEIFYNIQNNVESIVTKKSEYNYTTNTYDFDANTLKRTVETFSNYDQFANPLKNLGIFDELFYRSLSANNFKNYELKSFDETGSPNGATAQRNWNFVYENGQINFAK